MSEKEFFESQDGLQNSAQVQDHLLREIMRNAGQLNFRSRAALLSHLQGLQMAEISGKPQDPAQPDLPFIGEH